MIELTNIAKSKIQEIANTDALGHMCVRVKAIGGGCSGISFDMFYDDQRTDNDEVFDYGNGVKLIVDQLSFCYIDGLTIDYIDKGFEGGFKFLGGSIKTTCGCGKSVSF